MKKSLYIFFIALITISGCKQDSDVVNPDTTLRSTGINKDLSLTVPEAICANKDFNVSLISRYTSGNLQVQISKDNGKSWSTTAETSRKLNKNSEEFYLNLEAGNYQIRGMFKSTNSVQDFTEPIEITVSDCEECDGLILDPNLSGNDFLVNAGEKRSFIAEYTVIACDQDYYDLILKGGLVSGVHFSSASPDDAEIENGKQNTEISWYLGDVKKGFAKTFKVKFEIKVPAVPYGTMFPLTSGFVLEGKSANGTGVMAGNYNEIFVQVQEEI